MLFYLKYEKYCALLFLMMSLVNIVLVYLYFLNSYQNQQVTFTSFLQRFTVRSLIDIEKGDQMNEGGFNYIWITLGAFIFHILLQHLEIYMY